MRLACGRKQQVQLEVFPNPDTVNQNAQGDLVKLLQEVGSESPVGNGRAAN
jgi:hypothetical protein